jgi:protease-4
MSQGAKDAFQMGIEHGYNRFVGLVSDSRDIPLETLKSIAEGRVWTGKDALTHGLVDKMGDFDDAVTLAAELAELENYNVSWVQDPLTPAQKFFQEMMNQVYVSFNIDMTTWLSASWLPQSWLPVINQVSADISLLDSFNDPKGHYAFCLNCQVQ